MYRWLGVGGMHVGRSGEMCEMRSPEAMASGDCARYACDTADHPSIEGALGRLNLRLFPRKSRAISEPPCDHAVVRRLNLRLFPRKSRAISENLLKSHLTLQESEHMHAPRHAHLAESNGREMKSRETVVLPHAYLAQSPKCMVMRSLS